MAGATKFSLLILALVALGFLVVLILSSARTISGDKKIAAAQIVQIGDNRYAVEIANTSFTHMRGLSYRDSLAPGTGMLFLFPQKSTHSFWMKGMRFSIDIIWITDGQVVGFSENASIPAGLPLTTYAPPLPIDMVLEVNAGTVLADEIRVGDKVNLQ